MPSASATPAAETPPETSAPHGRTPAPGCGREAISQLVPGQRLSSSATLLPQQSPAGDMANRADAWKEAIRLAKERGTN